MSKFFAALALAAALMMVASPAAAGTAITLNGPLTPLADSPDQACAYLISGQSIDAQNGPDVIISGWVNVRPVQPGYRLLVGLVTKEVRDALISGNLTTPIWDGIYGLLSQEGIPALRDRGYEVFVGTQRTSDVNADGHYSFKLQLKPRLGRTGGTAIFKTEGRNSFDCGYGNRLNDSNPGMDYSTAYLVAAVWSESGVEPINFTATAKQLTDAVRVKKIVTRDAALAEQTTFHAGDVVNVATAYRIISTRTKRIQYELRAEVALFGEKQAYNDPQSRVGGYAFTRSFMVPLKAKPGNYRAQVTLKLVRHLTDRNTNEPYEQLLYTEEVSKKITVE